MLRDPTARLQRPLRRVGPKGEGQFEPVSWDTALAEIAGRLNGILATQGPASVWHTHYTGTCSIIAGGFPMRFFNRLGASEVEPDSICNAAGHKALEYIYGSSTTGFDPRSIKDAACALLWGINPSASAPHAHKHWFKEAKAFRIVVDPVRHGTAQAADLYLQVRPGTDSALAFAMLHVMKRDGLIDRKFLAANSIGWDEVEPLLAPCTPQWGEAQTGVPAADIERAARAFANGPSLLWLGQGLQRQPLGGNIFRAVSLLSAASGNIGKPGSGFYYLNGSGRKGIDGAYVDGASLRRAPDNSVSHMDLCAKLEDSEAARALFCWNINIAASNPDQARLRRALAREDLLTVVLDLYQTDTADFADYVLPAASFLEFDDVVSSYFNLTLSAQNQVMAPMGEALPNQEIFRRLAAAMGFTEPELFESDKTLLTNLAAQAHIAGGYEALAKAGTVDLWQEPVLQFARPEVPHAQRQDRDRLGAGRSGRPPAHAAAADRRTAGQGQSAPAVAGFALADEQLLRQRR